MSSASRPSGAARVERSRYRMRESALAIALTAMRLADSRIRVLKGKPTRSKWTANPA